MSMTKIHYACGCEGYVNLSGKRSTHADKIAWLEEQECPNCRRQKETEAAKKLESEMQLSTINTGSVKQCEWATRIRAEVIQRYQSAINSEFVERTTTADIAKNFVSNVKDLLDGEESEINSSIEEIVGAKFEAGLDAMRTFIRACLNMAIKRLAKMSESRWLIDNRDWIDNQLARLMAKEVSDQILGETPEESTVHGNPGEMVTLTAKSWGTCRNGSYYLKTAGVCETTDQKVNAQMAFVKSGTENGDGTLTISSEDAYAALSDAKKRTEAYHSNVARFTVSLVGNPEIVLF